MKDPDALLELEDYERLTSTIPYLLAGLENHTNGHEIKSITVQQTRVSGYRVVARAIDRSDAGDPIHVVGFSSSDQPGTALLIFEAGYRDNLIRWSVDRFAKSLSDNGSAKNEKTRLSITN